jgi:hypothetical protein
MLDAGQAGAGRDAQTYLLTPVWPNLVWGQNMTIRLLLLGVSVASLNAALLSSASRRHA